MDIPHDTWIVVADGEKFLLLRNEGDEEYPNFQVITHHEVPNPPTREQGTGQPGRFDDAGVGKSAVEQTDWHWLGKERFAKDLAEKLHDWAYRKRFGKLIVVAAPKILGVLRPNYHEEVQRRLLGEVDKDLSNHTVRKMEQILKES
ncbi:MAG: host attachment protein [Alphaproteobacteria bacterium]